jgi:hypothetical protein
MTVEVNKNQNLFGVENGCASEREISFVTSKELKTAEINLVFIANSAHFGLK